MGGGLVPSARGSLEVRNVAIDDADDAAVEHKEPRAGRRYCTGEITISEIGETVETAVEWAGVPLLDALLRARVHTPTSGNHTKYVSPGRPRYFLYLRFCVLGEFLHSLADPTGARELVFAHGARERVAEDEDRVFVFTL